jgi:hypothetical protein
MRAMSVRETTRAWAIMTISSRTGKIDNIRIHKEPNPAFNTSDLHIPIPVPPDGVEGSGFEHARRKLLAVLVRRWTGPRNWMRSYVEDPEWDEACRLLDDDLLNETTTLTQWVEQAAVVRHRGKPL